MKICWEVLDKLRLTYLKFGPLKYRTADRQRQFISDWGIEIDGVPKYIETQWEYIDHCWYCGGDFLNPVTSKTHYCDSDCSRLRTAWRKDWKRLKKQRWNLMRNPKSKVIEKPATGMLGQPLGLVRGTPEELVMRLKINRENGRIRAAPFADIKGKAKYDTYAHQVSWFEDCRKDPKDSRLLQVRCFNSNCKKWFTPPSEHVKKMVGWSNSGKGVGKQNKVQFSVLYCSNGCGNQCKLLRLQETRCYKYKTGKLTWSQYHEIPFYILHYDWQAELAQIHNKMIVKLKEERLAEKKIIKKEKEEERKKKFWKGKRKWKKGETRPNPFGIYMCTTCRRFMGKDKFTERNIRKDNITGKCERCVALYMWLFHEEDRQKARDATRRWAQNN